MGRDGAFVAAHSLFAEEGPRGPGAKESAKLISIEPRPLHRGWPLFEASRHFELGSVFDCNEGDLPEFVMRQVLGHTRAGWWECDLSNNGLDFRGLRDLRPTQRSRDNEG